MKKSLIIALALTLVLAFASSAMAAQVLQDESYLSTTATGMDRTGNSVGSAFSRTYLEKQFFADGKTNYPYEIYLPNEQHPENYRIHSNYAKNTDACASCHATHTAVGASLLQWYTTYETCMACHDGTLGNATYNVEEGKIGAGSAPTFGGMFGSGLEGSLSNHNVTGSMEIAAAPGGTTVSTENVAGAHGARETRWVNEFGCESCHSPHGQGGNARILHPDANYAASWAAEKREVANKYFVNPADGKVYADMGYTQAVYIIKGYPYEPSVINGNVADKVYKIDNKSGASIVKDATGNATTNSAVYVLGVASLQVKMNISGYLTGAESVTHVYGMNSYCGACHTDYNTAAFMTTGSGQEETGVYAQAHRHQMGMDWYDETAGLKFETTKVKSYAIGSMECLTCHVAHGTSQDYWAATLKDIPANKTADGVAWPALATNTAYEELAGSSALKRMPNMGTCEACHAKGEGAEGYNTNAGIVPPPSGIEGISNAIPTFGYIGTSIIAAEPYVGSEACEPCHKDYVEGWKETKHAGSAVAQQHCGSNNTAWACHSNGAKYSKFNGGVAIIDAVYGTYSEAQIQDKLDTLSPFAWIADADHGQYFGNPDSNVTCESCHGSAAKHIAAPSSTNILMPGSTKELKALFCLRCHDHSIRPTTTTIYNNYENYDIHGGAWGFTSSKHYSEGIATCGTCHDLHNLNGEGEQLKMSYTQVCISCHDTMGTRVDVMGPQLLEGTEPHGYDHSFTWRAADVGVKAGVPAEVDAPEYSVTSFTYQDGGTANLQNAPEFRDVNGTTVAGQVYWFELETVSGSASRGAVTVDNFTGKVTVKKEAVTSATDNYVFEILAVDKYSHKVHAASEEMTVQKQ